MLSETASCFQLGVRFPDGTLQTTAATTTILPTSLVTGTGVSGQVALWGSSTGIIGDPGILYTGGSLPGFLLGSNTKEGYIQLFGGNGTGSVTIISDFSHNGPDVQATFPKRTGIVEIVIASGTTAMPTGALLTNTSAAATTTTATGAVSTDVVVWSYNAAPGAPNPLLTITPYVTAGQVHFIQSNPTSATQTPVASTINWRVLSST